ncbi:MAG: hypothetical protein K2R98_29620 [Gemmataceae bacterium]|nr:hypothetical protein [Gemmataceae bacterium]
MSAAPCAEPVGTSVESPTATPPDSGTSRDARGRFARGKPGGTGNPFARQVGALRSALVRPVNSVPPKMAAQSGLPDGLTGVHSR